MNHPGWKQAVVVAVFLAPALCRADFKITTRSTVMGHSSVNTVYIKGSRERHESGEGSASITQCDKGRMVVVNDHNKSYMVFSLGGGGAQPAGGRAPAHIADGERRKGGTITITSDTVDTGERQQMFGYTARHLKSTVTMDSSPDSCSPGSMRMESDGWYADLSPSLSCNIASTMNPRSFAGGGARGGCIDKPVFKQSGSAKPGFPLKVTTTMQMAQGMSMTSTTEVTDLSNTTLEASLFEIPAGYREIKISGVTSEGEEPAPAAGDQGGAQAPPAEAPPQAAQAPANAPAAPAAPEKAAGALRIGVVRFDDQTGQSMPTDNLRDMMMGEMRMNHQLDTVPIDSTTPEEILNEARMKNCDYIVTTTLAQLVDGPAATLPAAYRMIAITGTGRYLGRIDFEFTRVGMRTPQLKTSEAARADNFPVNAISDSVDKEVEAVYQELQHPHRAAPALSPAKKPVVHKAQPKNQ